MSDEKYLKSIVDFGHQRNLGTISTKIGKDGSDNKVIFQPLSNSHILVALTTDKYRNVYVSMFYDNSKGVTPGDLHAVNTFLYTYNVYSLPMSTVSRLKNGTVYPANVSAYDQEFAGPKEHKKAYESYICFMNKAYSIIRDMVDRESIGRYSHQSERQNLYVKTCRRFMRENKFSAEKNYEYSDEDWAKCMQDVDQMITAIKPEQELPESQANN
ncbi:MAG TPA: hypothetical protein PLQ04_01370 [Lachnospiraceae bacterium]|nr:hypothetical protein [Lachnospiraceae bacterium]